MLKKFKNQLKKLINKKQENIYNSLPEANEIIETKSFDSNCPESMYTDFGIDSCSGDTNRPESMCTLLSNNKNYECELSSFNDTSSNIHSDVVDTIYIDNLYKFMNDVSIGILNNGYTISPTQFLILYDEINNYDTQLFGEFQIRLTKNKKELLIDDKEFIIDDIIKYCANLDYDIEIIKHVLYKIEILQQYDTVLFTLYDFCIISNLLPFIMELSYLMSFYHIELVFIEEYIEIKPIIFQEIINVY